MGIKRILRNWLLNDDQTEISAPCKAIESDDMRAEPTLNFRVFAAVGGRVVEFRKYDRQTDRSEGQTYIIKDSDDFGEAIAKIASMEMIKG